MRKSVHILFCSVCICLQMKRTAVYESSSKAALRLFSLVLKLKYSSFANMALRVPLISCGGGGRTAFYLRGSDPLITSQNYVTKLILKELLSARIYLYVYIYIK